MESQESIKQTNADEPSEMNSKYTGKSAKVYSELVRKKKCESSIENSKKRIHKVTKRIVVAEINQIDSS